MGSRAFLVGTIVVVFGAIAVGIALTGGPIQARHDRFDKARLNDLDAIADALHCRKQTRSNAVLPAELTQEAIEAHCSRANLLRNAFVDEETGEPYRYIRASDREFSICAGFHDARRLTTSGDYRRVANGWPASFAFDPQTGCLSGALWTKDSPA